MLNKIIEDIISKLPFKEKVSMANMDKEAVEVIQIVFDLYIKNKIGTESEEEHTIKGDGVEFRRFFFHLLVVMKSHATSSQNRCAGCLASYHMQGYRATKHF
ncbi:MAG: hypothetical protein JRD05_11300 [Deltaproteobacteria bacterium]|nr:hypothetical protein [Deltaproteobacteria bacterium]